MNRRILFAGAALALAALFALGRTADAQQTSDLDAIKAANAAFYIALSARDVKAMEAVWANKPYVVNFGPRNKAPAIGYADAVTKYWPNTFDVFSQITASSTTIAQIQSDGKLGWVVGTETASLQPKAGGDPLKFEAFATNLFEKDGDRWLMISHHAQAIAK